MHIFKPRVPLAHMLLAGASSLAASQEGGQSIASLSAATVWISFPKPGNPLSVSGWFHQEPMRVETGRQEGWTPLGLSKKKRGAGGHSPCPFGVRLRGVPKIHPFSPPKMGGPKLQSIPKRSQNWAFRPESDPPRKATSLEPKEPDPRLGAGGGTEVQAPPAGLEAAELQHLSSELETARAGRTETNSYDLNSAGVKPRNLRKGFCV